MTMIKMKWDNIKSTALKLERMIENILNDLYNYF